MLKYFLPLSRRSGWLLTLLLLGMLTIFSLADPSLLQHGETKHALLAYADQAGADALYLFPCDSGEFWQTMITLTNLENREVKVDPFCYHRNGDFLGGSPFIESLQAEGTQTIKAEEIGVPGCQTLALEADGKMVGALLLTSLDGKKSEAIPARHKSAKQLDFPPLLEGDTEDKTITLLNPEFSTVNLEVIALDPDGGELEQTFLPPLSSRENRTFAVKDLFSPESLYQLSTVRVISDNRIVGLQLVDSTPGDLVGLPALTSTSHKWSFPILTMGGEVELWTTVGLFNPGEVSAFVTIEAFDAEDASLGIIETTAFFPGAIYDLHTANMEGIIPQETAVLKVTADEPIIGYTVIGAVEGRGVTATLGIPAEDQMVAGFEIIGSADGSALEAFPMIMTKNDVLKSTAESLGEDEIRAKIEIKSLSSMQILQGSESGEKSTTKIKGLTEQAQEEGVSIGQIFIGNSPPIPNSSAVLYFSQDLENRHGFRWISSDSILYDIDTGFTSAPMWVLVGDPPTRLVFRGSGDGAAFYGNVLFEPYNRAVVDVVKDAKRVRYLLKIEPIEMIMVNISDKEIHFAPEASEEDQAPFNAAPGEPGGNGGFGGPPGDTTMATLSDAFKLHSVTFNPTYTPRTIDITLKSNVSTFEQAFILTEDADGSNYFTDSTGSHAMTILKGPSNDNSITETVEVFFTSTTFGRFGAETLTETGVNTNVFESEHSTMKVEMDTVPSDTIEDTMTVTLDSDLVVKAGIGPITETLYETGGPATNVFVGATITLEAIFFTPESGGRLSMTATVNNDTLGFNHLEIDAGEDIDLPFITLTTDALHNQDGPTFISADLRSYFWSPLMPKEKISEEVAKVFDFDPPDKEPEQAVLVYKRGNEDWQNVGDGVDGEKLDFLRLFNDNASVRMSIKGVPRPLKDEPKTSYRFYVIEDNDPAFATPRWHRVANPGNHWSKQGICTDNKSVILAGIKGGDILRLVWDRDRDGAYGSGDGRDNPDVDEVYAEVIIIKVDLDSISFKGVHSKNIPLKHHDNGNINAPEWKDDNGDGSPDDEWKNVGAWVKNSTTNPTPIQVKTKFKVQPSTLTSLKVYAQKVGGPGHLYKPSTTDPLEITATSTWEGTFELDTTINAIKYFKKGDWKWEWRVTEVNGTAMSSACKVGETTHDICVAASDPVAFWDAGSSSPATPVYKWVMMASCKAADGQTASPDTEANTKTIVDDIYNDLAACARVDNWSTKLNYAFPDTGGVSTLDSLLDDTSGSCGDWRRYLFALCAAQGVGTAKGLKMANFVIQNHGTAPEIMWNRFRVTHIGINNSSTADPRITLTTPIVDDGKYPNPQATEVNNQTVTWWGSGAFFDHSIVFLNVAGDNDHLYDPSFPVAVATTKYPSAGATTYNIGDNFIGNYFKTSCPYLFGRIKWQGVGTTVYCHIHTKDFGNTEASPATVKMNWTLFN